jgi:hypothetical protein
MSVISRHTDTCDVVGWWLWCTDVAHRRVAMAQLRVSPLIEGGWGGSYEVIDVSAEKGSDMKGSFSAQRYEDGGR